MSRHQSEDYTHDTIADIPSCCAVVIIRASHTVMHKQYLQLAIAEPTLWHRPFHAGSYSAVLDAEREVLAALSLMKRAGQSFSAICTAPTWHQEVTGIPLLYTE